MIVGIFEVGHIKPAEKTKGSELNKTTRVASSFLGINKPIRVPKYNG